MEISKDKPKGQKYIVSLGGMVANIQNNFPNEWQILKEHCESKLRDISDYDIIVNGKFFAKDIATYSEMYAHFRMLQYETVFEYDYEEGRMVPVEKEREHKYEYRIGMATFRAGIIMEDGEIIKTYVVGPAGKGEILAKIKEYEMKLKNLNELLKKYDC